MNIRPTCHTLSFPFFLPLLLIICSFFSGFPQSAQGVSTSPSTATTTCQCDFISDTSGSCVESAPNMPGLCIPVDCPPGYQCVEGGSNICKVLRTSLNVLQFTDSDRDLLLKQQQVRLKDGGASASGSEIIMNVMAKCELVAVIVHVATLQQLPVQPEVQPEMQPEVGTARTAVVPIAKIKPAFANILADRTCSQQCAMSSLICSSALTTQFAKSDSSNPMVIIKGTSTLTTHCRDQTAATNVFGYNANAIDADIFQYNLCIHNGRGSSTLCPQTTTASEGTSMDDPCTTTHIADLGYSYSYACMCNRVQRKFSLLPSQPQHTKSSSSSSRPNLVMSAIMQDRLAASNVETTLSNDQFLQSDVDPVCDTYPTPGNMNRNQVCCSFDGVRTFHCLPTFLIVGAQKAGTTALYTYISEHPSFLKNQAFGKELHFFDIDVKYNDGLEAYFKMQPTVRESEIALTITGEASPSYMAKLGVCRSIAEVDPSMKLIVMLRDPIERAWSEIQMKVRQDASLRSWMALLRIHGSNLYMCLNQAALHPDHPQVRKLVPGTRGNRQKLLQRRANVLSAFTQCVAPELTQHVRWPHFVQNVLAGEIMTGSYSKLFTDAAGASNTTVPQLNVHAFQGFCEDIAENYMERFPQQELDLLHELEEEIHLIERCLEDAESSQPDHDMSHCFPRSVNPSDISKDYVWRGMYAKQLKECMLYIPPENMLIIETQELRNAVQQTMKRVFDFLGLDQNSSVALIKRRELEQAIRKSHPGFEELTGWRLHGTEPSQIPVYVRETLSAFYAPHNEELFQLLGRRYEHWQISPTTDDRTFNSEVEQNLPTPTRTHNDDFFNSEEDQNLPTPTPTDTDDFFNSEEEQNHPTPTPAPTDNDVFFNPEVKQNHQTPTPTYDFFIRR